MPPRLGRGVPRPGRGPGRAVGLATDAVEFASGRELRPLLEAASASRPFLLAVGSTQTLRDPEGSQTPRRPRAGPIVRGRARGAREDTGISVVMTGHVTKDGDVAGPRTLEHAVDVVLTFDGDPRSGLRMLAGGKNRFGAEGEVAWFEMTPTGLHEIDAADLLVHGDGEAGSAIALPQAGRRALAVEVQALVALTEGSPRRQTSGLDARRFQLVAAVLERNGFPVARSDLYGASAGGISAWTIRRATSRWPPRWRRRRPTHRLLPDPRSSARSRLTGIVRGGGAIAQRLAAARAAGVRTVFVPRGTAEEPGLRSCPCAT